ncbi:MAG: hypothetical protein FWE76_05750, partial [Symbiobacteriaceae bacterium]|nr:hypothetical protein [Symbiobacteriaceae bacterium]
SIAANNLNMGNIISKDIAAGTIAFGYGEGPNFVYRMSMLNGERAGTLDLADCLAVSSAKAIIGFPLVAEILHADLRQVFFFSPNFEDLLYVQTLLARDALDLDLLAEGCTLSRFVCWLDEDGEVFTGMMDPILNNTCLQALQVLEVVPVAFVEKVPGNKNILTIIIYETYSNGHAYEKTAEFVIDNNAADYYLVPTENEYQQYVYKVYVDTKGNTQIRDCYIVN